MIDFPNIEPVAFSIGPFAVRWYALAYIAGLVFAVWYVKRLVGTPALWADRTPTMAPRQADDLSIWIALGVILGSIGFARIMLWPTRTEVYGPDYVMVAFTIAFSLVGIVLWGTVAGSMLPLILRRLGLDPASASAPFVATIVDVTGLVIYFSVARMILGGILL